MASKIEPVAWACEFFTAWNNIAPKWEKQLWHSDPRLMYGDTLVRNVEPLYTEAQFLAAEQRGRDAERLKWSDDFTEARKHKALIVWATDDDGFAYGIGLWASLEGTDDPLLVWADHPGIEPINTENERALLWTPLPSPGEAALRAAAIRKGDAT